MLLFANFKVAKKEKSIKGDQLPKQIFLRRPLPQSVKTGTENTDVYDLV